ncbi:MAG: hypothetical protein LUC24_00155 [Bacteroidales bacterium]|nr:hypothetical protein [Bacteroidales bacterium]
MKVEIATLCKYASDHNGSLTIVDTFDRLFADKFPFKTDFCFVFRVNVEGLPVGSHKICLDIADNRNETSKIFGGQYNFAMKDNIENVNCAANLKGLVFDAAGQYDIRVSFDDETIITHPFKLLHKDEKSH